MHTGQLNKQVTIEKVTETKDALGGVTRSWTPYKKAWAYIPEHESMWLSESTVAGREKAVASVNATIRYTSGITEKMRVVYNGVPYDILGIANVKQRNQWLMLALQRGKESR